jgi:hypothetical protein
MPCHVALERAEQRTKQARPGSKMSYLHASYRYNLPVLVLDVIILVPCSPIQLPEPNRLELSAATGAGVVRYARPSVLCCAVLCMICMYVQFVAVNRRSRSSACQPFPEDGISFLSFHQFRFRNCRHLSDSFRKPRTSNLALSFFPFLHPTPPPPPPSLPVTGSPPPRPSSSSSSSV